MSLGFPSDNRNATVNMPERISPLVDCEAAFDEAIERAHQVFGSPPQVIFCVFKVPNDARYDIFKSLGTSSQTFATQGAPAYGRLAGVRRGIATQAMQSKLLNKAGDFQAFIK